MRDSFEPLEHIRILGEDLVADFNRSDRNVRPAEVGQGKELSVQRRLESLLPGFIGVGSGYVIDHQGNTSRQIDVVLYEKDLCPVFIVNDDPRASYFPCEGVIAAGEIKTDLRGVTLNDIVDKIHSVKSLRRYAHGVKDEIDGTDAEVVPYRQYSSRVEFAPTVDDQFNQALNLRDQIYGFAIAHRCSMRDRTLLDHMANLVGKRDPRSSVAFLLSSLTEGTVMEPAHVENNMFNVSWWRSAEASELILCNLGNDAFGQLLSRLRNVCFTHRTVSANAFNQYFRLGDSEVLDHLTL